MTDIDPVLLGKIETAVHTTLMTIIRSVVAVGMTPSSAISMVRTRLDNIETMVKEEASEAVADVPVRHTGGERSQAEAWMEATHPEASARHAADVRGERGVQSPEGNPRRTTGTDNQATYRRFGLRPDVGPNHPYS